MLIDLLRKRREAKTFITDVWAQGRTLHYSSITVAELFAGMRPGEEAAVAALFGGELATLNTKHYPMTDMVVIKPYSRP